MVKRQQFTENQISQISLLSLKHNLLVYHSAQNPNKNKTIVESTEKLVALEAECSTAKHTFFGWYRD